MITFASELPISKNGRGVNSFFPQFKKLNAVA
jgi:hypothetical protein